MNATELTDLEIANLKESLLYQKSIILNKSHEFKEEQSSITFGADEVEVATQDIVNNISIHLHERDRTALYAIEKALSKIADRTYGKCESCSDLITARRLQVRPFTALCVNCMEEHESLATGFQ